MTVPNQKSFLGNFQRTLLVFLAIFLGIALYFLRGQIGNNAPLDKLSRHSVNLETALNNDRPTILEFYADWCEACREMAPAMLKLDQENRDQIDFVFLNVDNNLWQDYIEEYEVIGIPHLNFFDERGELKGKLVGSHPTKELESLINSLRTGDLLSNDLNADTVGEFGMSKINKKIMNTSLLDGPRSHG